jgi:MraZ protein
MSTEIPASYADNFEHTFDDKGRITVPSEWRQPGFETYLYIFPSTEKCLKVFPASWLAERKQEVKGKGYTHPKRKALELLTSRAQTAIFDAQGRIMIKEKMRAGAGLKREVVLEGRSDHFQIWDKAAWSEQNARAITFEETMDALEAEEATGL